MAIGCQLHDADSFSSNWRAICKEVNASCYIGSMMLHTLISLVLFSTILASALHATREGCSMLRLILSDFEAVFRESAKIDQERRTKQKKVSSLGGCCCCCLRGGNQQMRVLDVIYRRGSKANSW